MRASTLDPISFGGNFGGRELGPFRIDVERDPAKLTAAWPRTITATTGRRYVFQCADVLEVWCDTLGKAQGIDPVFVAVFDARDEPLLLLPLGIRRRHGGVRQLFFLDEGVSDYNAPVVFAGARDWDAATMRRVWRDIVASLPPFDIAVFEKMPEVVEDWPNPLRFLSTAKCRWGAHAMILPADWDNGGKNRLPNWRDSRRRMRKLSERGTMTIGAARSADEASAFLDAMIAMKRRKLRDLTGVDPFEAKAGFADYYFEATRRLFAGGAVHLSALRMDDQILSAHWGYVLGGRFYQLMPAFRDDGAWGFYAPGRLLNEHLIEWSTRQGLTIFDFGYGDEPYKTTYCDTHFELRESVMPVTTTGRLWMLARDVRRVVSRSLAHRPRFNQLTRALGDVAGRARRFVVQPRRFDGSDHG